MRREASLVVLSLGMMVIACSPYATRADELEDGVSKLLNTTNGEPASVLEAARAQYARLKRLAPDDTRVDYALAIVLIAQHKYAEAAPLVKRHVSDPRAEPHAYCTLLWLALVERHHAQAFDTALALAKRFPRGDAPEPSYFEAAEFLGTALAYLEHARPGSADPAAMAKATNEILPALGQTYLPAFDTGRRAVVDRLAELKRLREAERQQAAAASEKRDAANQKQLDRSKERIASRQESMQTSEVRVRDAQREMNLIETQIASLQRDRVRITAQHALLQSQMFATDPALFNIWGGNTGAAASAVGRQTVFNLLNSLMNLTRQGMELDRKIQGLRNRAAQLSAQADRELLSQADDETAISQQEKRAQALERQNRAGTARKPVREAPLTAKMTSLSTYAPFPFSQEKQRIQAWFAR